MKRVIFIVHGVGRHNAGWSQEFSKRFKALLNALEEDDGFERAPLVAELKNTTFVEVLYDDIYQQFVAVMLEREGAFIEALQFAGLKSLAKLFTTDSAEKSAVRDNIFDILVYRAMREHRLMTRKHVALQMMKAVRELGTDEVEYSVVAHSMGTAVMHDTLQEMATESGSPLRHGFAFSFKNLAMVANTSALLRNDFDPRESLVRPFIAVNDPGYVTSYLNFSHKFDPVAQIYSYEGYMKGQPAKRYTYATISHIQEKNIHALLHYLNDPGVYIRLFNAIYGKKLVPDAYVKAVAMQAPGKTLKQEAADALIGKITLAIQPAGPPDPDERSAGLIAIAKLLPEVV